MKLKCELCGGVYNESEFETYLAVEGSEVVLILNCPGTCTFSASLGGQGIEVAEEEEENKP